MKRKKLSDKELAMNYIFPNTLSKEEKELADLRLLKFRLQRLKETTPEDRLYYSILKLKYEMYDYLNQDEPVEKKSFADFLNKYLEITHKKNKDFAKDLNIHSTKISRILHKREKANKSLIYRLGAHSSESIPSYLWYKLYLKDEGNDFVKDKKTKLIESQKIRNKIKLKHSV